VKNNQLVYEFQYKNQEEVELIDLQERILRCAEQIGFEQGFDVAYIKASVGASTRDGDLIQVHVYGKYLNEYLA
jgi:hypothetical protein